jgi:hypothetical protein
VASWRIKKNSQRRPRKISIGVLARFGRVVLFDAVGRYVVNQAKTYRQPARQEYSGRLSTQLKPSCVNKVSFRSKNSLRFVFGSVSFTLALTRRLRDRRQNCFLGMGTPRGAQAAVKRIIPSFPALMPRLTPNPPGYSVGIFHPVSTTGPV